MNGKFGKVFITTLLAAIILAFQSSWVVRVNPVPQDSIQSPVPLIKTNYAPVHEEEENLTKRIDELNATLRDFNSTLYDLKGVINDLKAKIADLKKAFADLTQWLYIISGVVPLIVVAVYHVAVGRKRAK